MRYTVTWQPSPWKKLATIWTAGPDRAAITAAANLIDDLLLHDASTQGEARDDGTRTLICTPLAVYFRVQEDDRLASVFDVWRWTP